MLVESVDVDGCQWISVDVGGCGWMSVDRWMSAGVGGLGCGRMWVDVGR